MEIDDVKCPKCGGKLIPWIFGMPTSDVFEKSERNEVILGGCLVGGNEPSWHCLKCEHDFDKALKDLGKTENEEEEEE